MSGDLIHIVQRLEAAVTRLEQVGGAGQGSGTAHHMADSGETHASVKGYDDLLANHFEKYYSTSQKIGGDVKTHADLVKDAFTAQRNFLNVPVKFSKPSDQVMAQLLQPMAAKIEAITNFRESNRRSPFFNHLSAISEAVPALGWVQVAPAPGPFVKEMADAGQFYTNRVLKEFKEKDETHVVWVKAWISMLIGLQGYIKDHHTTGLSWNPSGPPASAASATSAGRPGPPPPGGVPPPPPPPPPPAAMEASSGGGDDVKRAALFSELNKGEAVTQGLKKVTDDMKTHKNPALRSQGKSAPPPTAPKPGQKKPPTSAPAAPPKLELEGNKWAVENYKGKRDIVIDETEFKHTVYIYRCNECTIQVKGKLNSIVLDTCKKTALVFEDLISSLNIVNCQSVQTQVLGMVPIVSIDKTDGCQVYLSEHSKTAEIVSAKSSEMNILIPKGDGDFDEFPVPEQYKTKYNGKTLVTQCNESV